MARWCFCLAAGLCLAAAGSGCSALRTGSSFASTDSPSSTASRYADDSEPDLSTKETSSSQKRATAYRNKRRKRAADQQIASQSRFDEPESATQALIDWELRDASPEERTALLPRLQKLPDESVRHILSERRKGLNLAQNQNVVPKQNPTDQLEPPLVRKREPAAAPAIAQIAAAESPERETHSPARRRPAINGLGTVSAWGHSGVPRKDQPADGAEPDGAVEGAEPFAELTEELPESPTVRHVSFGQVQADSTNSGQYSTPRTEGGAPGTATTAAASAPATAAQKSPAAALAAKGNPILGYLLPGRFGAAGATAKPAATPGASPVATVAVGVPRETAANPPPTTAASAAVIPADTAEMLRGLLAAAETDAAALSPGDDETERQAYIERHVYLRMLYLMAGQQERALQAIPGIDPADQEFWQQTFWGLTNYFDSTSMPSSADRAAQTVSQLTKAVLRLQEKAHLELRNVNFCHKIASFGNYEKYPRDEFSPGQEVLLYAEVANIHSESAADGKFRTSLKSTIEVFRHGAEGELVERIELPETVDLCRTHRRDYFHSYQFTIPAKLTLGPHVLKLTVEDQLSRRATTYALNFMVK